MKAKIFIAVAILLLAAVGVWFWAGSGKTETQQVVETEHEYYTCPMHPSVISDRPGACPVCGMALVKKTAQQEIDSKELAALGAVSLSPTQRVVANVSTVRAERRTLVKEISAVGVVSVAEPLQATVAARFRGRIEKLHVSYTGERVARGAPLFDLYSPDLVSATQEYLLALQNSGMGEGRNSTMAGLQDGLKNAARERLRVHFGLTEDQIQQMDQTGTAKSTTTFFSPIAGTVLQKPVMEGQYVDEGMVLYELSDLSHVWVYLDVYEQDLRFVHLRQDVSVMADAYPGESFSGRVTFIDPVINPETRTVRVRAEFQNRSGKLKPNMYVKANVSIPIENALVIPTSAILSTGQRDVVWVEISKDSFVPREVMLGAKTEQFSQIVRGLSEGDMVAATGGYLIDSESSLQLPTGGDPHAGHGVSSPKEIRTEPAPAAVEFAKPGNNGVVTVPILVKGKYLPEEIHVKVGEKVRLDFFRDEDADCTNEVVFEGLQLRKRLPAREHTIIELTPTATGEIPFACGMGMVRGKLIVHK